MVLPPEPADFELGYIALDFAREAGYTLDPWQAWLVFWTFARQEDGLWSARDFGIEVSRQNGKNIWMEVVQLCSLLILGDDLITHTSHRDDTNTEHFLSLRTAIESSDFLSSFLKKSHNGGFVTANGKQSIEFANGHRLLFKARAKASGRGPRPKKLFYDEALVLTLATLGTQAPSVSAQPNPQIIFGSSPPVVESEAQHALRERCKLAKIGAHGRFFYAAWNNEPTVDDDDPQAIARANPSLGRGRITVQSVRDNQKLMSREDYRREHLGVADDPPEGAGQLIPREVWDNLQDLRSVPVSHRTIAVAISADRDWATVGVSGRNEAGQIHIEWKTRKQGVSWLLDELYEAQQATGYKIRIWASGAAGSLIEECAAYEVDGELSPIETVSVSTAEFVRATSSFIDAIRSGGLAHLGQASLWASLESATLVETEGGGRVISPKRSKKAVDAIEACVVALGGVFGEPEEDDEWWMH